MSDWSGSHRPGGSGPAWAVFSLGAALACAAAAGLGAWAGGPGVGAVAGLLAGAALGVVLLLQRRLVVLTAGARALRPGEAPRLVNLATGLATDIGVAVPELLIASRPEPNAFVWNGRRPVLAVTSGLVEGFARTELEAVLAHSLLRLRSASATALPPAVLLSRLRMGRERMVTVGDDLRAAALTRYPPALASAISKCSPDRSRAAPAYFVAEGPSHVPVQERLSALSDL